MFAAGGDMEILYATHLQDQAEMNGAGEVSVNIKTKAGIRLFRLIT
jgi:hypothetical protein